MYLWLAIRVFFAVLFNGKLATAVRSALNAPVSSMDIATNDAAGAAPTQGNETASAQSGKTKTATHPVPKAPSRSDAVSLLALLQREGRLVDFLMEPLHEYTDEQVGAAARAMHTECSATVKRVFDLVAVRTELEGSKIDIPAGFDASALRLTGNLSGLPPYGGLLRHPGWKATKCEIPTWTGSPDGALVVAPAEVEVGS